MRSSSPKQTRKEKRQKIEDFEKLEIDDKDDEEVHEKSVKFNLPENSSETNSKSETTSPDSFEYDR